MAKDVRRRARHPEPPATPEVLSDATDLALLAAVRDEGRATVQSLAARLGVSGATVSVRLQRLIQRGFVRGFHADVAREWLGYPMCVYVMLRVSDPTGDHGEMSTRLLAIPEVEEVAWITGDYDVLIRAWVRDTKHLERVVVSLNEIGGGRSTTMLVVGERHTKPALDFEKLS